MTNDTTTPSRRTIMGAMAAGTMAAVSAAGTAQAQTTPKTFVLAHGAWHGGW
ncbi:MAG: hypothetical protein ABWY92_05690 [Xanthobacteraceae bacterium]